MHLHQKYPIATVCEVLSYPRSQVYYERQPVTDESEIKVANESFVIDTVADLRLIYTAATEAEAEQRLVEFAETWDKQYHTISKSWITHWQRNIPFFAFPLEIRRVIYNTNAIESVNMGLRKVLKDHRAFPADESAIDILLHSRLESDSDSVLLPE